MKLLKNLGFTFTSSVVNTNTIEQVVTKGKTTNEIIDEIHETFYTEVDRLLADAKILTSTDTNLQPLLDKYEKLKALGFINTAECKEAVAEIARLQAIKHENANKEQLTKAVNYFSMKYPNNKFITEDSVKKICAKYSLVYGTIDKYIGTVPDKNLAEIASFKIDNFDKACFSSRLFLGWDNRNPSIEIMSYARMKSYSPNRDMDYHYDVEYSECKLEIAAPLKDFNMDKHEIKDFKISKIEIPDPVVLQPVLFENTKYYLILSAWGQEATDELVVNQKFN